MKFFMTKDDIFPTIKLLPSTENGTNEDIYLSISSYYISPDSNQISSSEHNTCVDGSQFHKMKNEMARKMKWIVFACGQFA